MRLRDVPDNRWFYLPGSKDQDSAQKLSTQPDRRTIRVMVITKAGGTAVRKLKPSLDVTLVPEDAA